MSHFQPCRLEEGGEQMSLTSGPDHGGEEGLLEVPDAVGRVVRQVAVLGVAPDRLHRVEIWRVRRQRFDDDPSTSFKPVLDELCSVRLAAVPNERESLGQMPPQSLKEVENFAASDVVRVLSPIQAIASSVRGNRDRTDGRQSITTVPLPKDRCLAARCPGPSDHRLEHEATFIEKYDRSAGSPGVFLYGASAPFATSRWPFRLAPELVAPVSDNSIPPHAALSRLRPGGSEPRRCGR